jgi:threonine dehydrogenase-like Zn-dependent dehydrogenase
MLSDIFPTGYHATELVDVQPGESVVIYGAGPVGLMAAYSSILKGAGKEMVVTGCRTASLWLIKSVRFPLTIPQARQLKKFCI